MRRDDDVRRPRAAGRCRAPRQRRRARRRRPCPIRARRSRASSSMSSPRAALTIRTPSRIFAIAAALIAPRVSSVSGRCKRQEIRACENLVRWNGLLDAELAEALGRDERVVGEHLHLRPSARRATWRPIRPKPSTPSALSASSTPPHFERSQRPCDERGMGLRDVARERDEQARSCARRPRRCSTRAHSRRRCPRRVAASTSTLSTPTPARPITFSWVAELDQRRRSPSSPSERRARRSRRGSPPAATSRVDVNVEARAQQLEAGIRDRLADEDPRTRRRAASKASNARGDGDAALDLGAELREGTSSIAASAVAMSKTSNQPMWPMRKILPFNCALAAGASVTPWRSRRCSSSSSPSIPSGARTAVTTAARVVVGREELEAHRLDPGARGAAEADVALERAPRARRRAAARARRRGCGSARPPE